MHFELPASGGLTMNYWPICKSTLSRKASAFLFVDMIIRAIVYTSSVISGMTHFGKLSEQAAENVSEDLIKMQ